MRDTHLHRSTVIVSNLVVTGQNWSSMVIHTPELLQIFISLCFNNAFLYVQTLQLSLTFFNIVAAACSEPLSNCKLCFGSEFVRLGFHSL